MAVLVPAGADSNRAYYGSDTRAQALLVGAALAFALSGRGTVESRRGRWAVLALGLAGAAGAAAMWGLVPETSGLAFHGGFLLASLAAGAVVAAAALAPTAGVGRLLGVAPIRSVGRISYGMYLWYWPVLLVVTGARTHLHGGALFGVRVAVIVAIAAVSYRLVETPIQRGALGGRRAWLAGAVAAATAAAVAVVPATGAAARTVAEPTGSAAVTAAAAAGPRVRILLVGDSVAGTLAVGWQPIAARYGAEIVDEGQPGCSLATVERVRVLWYTIPPGQPCGTDQPAAVLASYRHWVDLYRPDVVVYLARSDLLTQEVGGRWTQPGDPVFDRWLTGRFRQAVAVLASGGAQVVLATTPVYDSGEGANGSPWPEDDPARVPVINAIIRTVGRSSGPAVSVLDLGGLLTPGGRYLATIDGQRVRCRDGVHISLSGGQWLAPRVLPQLVRLGRHHQAVVGARVAVPPMPPPPWWWSPLPCAT